MQTILFFDLENQNCWCNCNISTTYDPSIVIFTSMAKCGFFSGKYETYIPLSIYAYCSPSIIPQLYTWHAIFNFFLYLAHSNEMRLPRHETNCLKMHVIMYTGLLASEMSVCICLCNNSQDRESQSHLLLKKGYSAYSKYFHMYRHLQLPVNIRDKNMFCQPLKIKSFDNQTSKFVTLPLENILAPVTPMIIADLSAIWQDMAFTINKLGRNFKQGVPLSSYLQN